MFYAFNLKKFTKALKIMILLFIVVLIPCIGVRFLFPIEHYSNIIRCSEKYNLEPELICAVINTESRFDEEAVSNKGASGLMQIMKPTADWAGKEIGIKNYSYEKIFVPEINIEIGCWYLNKLKNQYNDDIMLVMASYNAGSGNVQKWLNDKSYSENGKELDAIPFEETRKYVERIKINKKVYSILLRVFGGNYAKE